MSGSSFWQNVWKDLCRNPLAIVALLILSIYLLLCALTAMGAIAADFNTVDNNFVHSPPSSQFWLGTDIFGRCVLSRALHATLTALSVGFFATLISLVIGGLLGALAGYFGGWIDAVVVWFFTTIESIPYILLLAAFAYVLGQGLINVYIALGLTSWVTLCRMVRGEFIKHRGREYVTAAKALGIGELQIMAKHIFPNILPIVLIQCGLIFVAAIKIEVILSYLGLGVQPGTPSWGLMIDDAKNELAQGVWWNLAGATLFMFGLILAINLLIDALRIAIDPKLQKRF